MLKRRLLRLTGTAITAVSAAVLATLPATSASATTMVAAPRQFTAAANTAGRAATTPPVRGVVHVIHRGLVRDCVYINDYQASLNDDETVGIAGGGVNEPVTLESPGNCFDLYYKFTYKAPDGDTYTGYEYQNGDGHCLWNDGGTIEVGAACKDGHANEEFFGYKYYSGLGWLFGNVTAGNDLAYVNAQPCSVTGNVVISDNASCGLWNFPSG